MAAYYLHMAANSWWHPLGACVARVGAGGDGLGVALPSVIACLPRPLDRPCAKYPFLASIVLFVLLFEIFYLDFCAFGSMYDTYGVEYQA